MLKNDSQNASFKEKPPRRQDMPPFEALRVFDAVGRLGGVRKAATWLDRDHAVVSRHLRSLETWLGMQLIERRPSGALLTKEGAAYHSIIAQSMDDICLATLDVLNQGHHNGLTIHCAPGFALHWLSGQLEAFEQKNADIDILLKPSEKSPDFAMHEADVDIRFNAMYEDQPEIESFVRSQTIARLPIVAVASPAYLEKSAPLATPADLIHHHLLHEDAYETWANWLRSNGADGLEELSGPRLSQGHLTLEAARRGRGVALSNYLAAARDLEQGRLVIIGEDNPAFSNLNGEYVLYMRADRWDDRAPRRFRQWMKRALNKDLPEGAKG